MVNQSYALTFNITRVTNNDRYDEYPPSLSNDKIAWIRGEGAGLQVFTWDGKSTAQLTADSLFRKDISIHNGKISYVAEEVLSGNVIANYLHYYDGNNYHLIDSTFYVGKYGLYSPSLHDGKIAWIKYHQDNNEYGLYYWDGNTIFQISRNQMMKYTPSTFQGTIAWSQKRSDNSGTEILYWDGISTRLVTNDGHAPSLFNGKIAFTRNDEIYLWDGSSIIQITNNSRRNRRPSLYENTIAWDMHNGTNTEIVFYDGSTTIAVTDTLSFDSQNACLNNGKIAFIGKPSGSPEIYYAEPILSVPNHLPSDGAINVLVDSDIIVTFVDEINPITLETTSFYITGVAGSISYDYDTKTATFTPTTDLNYETTYTATVTTNVEDLMGNSFPADYTWSFTTGPAPDTIPPDAPILNTSGTITDNQPLLDWQAVATAKYYDLEYSSSNNMTSSIIIEGLTASEYKIITSLDDGIWWWRVRAIDDYGNIGSWSSINSIIIDTQTHKNISLIPAIKLLLFD